MPTGQQDRLLALWRKAVRCMIGVQPQDAILALMITHRWSTSPPSHAVTNSLLQLYSCRNLVFMSTSMVPAGDYTYSVTLDHFSGCHWLSVSPSLTEHLSCGTCFPRRCKPPVPCQFFKREALSLLDSPVSGKNVLHLCFGNITFALLSFLFIPFHVGPLYVDHLVC